METSAAIAAALADAIHRGGGAADVRREIPEGYRVLGPRPLCMVAVRDEVAVRLVVAQCAREGWSLLARGGGTLDRLGAPLRDGPLVLLDTRALDGIVAHAPGDLTVRVRPGIRLAVLNAHLRASGQTAPLDPPGGEAATVGGVVAGDSWGPERAQYGGPRDLVLGLRVVDGAGTSIAMGGQVVKNVSGLDIGKLFVGSFGTLGILTEVALRLRPLPPRRTAWAVRPPDTAAAWRLAAALTGPGWQLSGAALDAGADGPVLSVGLEGMPAETREQERRLAELAEGVPLAGDPAGAAWRRAHDPVGPAPWAAMRLEVPEGALPGLWTETEARATRRVAWLGTGTLWCVLKRPDHEALAQWRRAAQAAGGRAILTWSPDPPPPECPPFGEPGELATLATALQRRFDPAGVLAPGRMGWPHPRGD